MASFDDPLLTGGFGFPASGGFDTATVAGMRVRKARAALDAGDPRQALVEAEELLDQHPDHVAALMLSGEAALRLGDGPMAVAAFDAVLRRHPDAPGARRMHAEARFMALDGPGARAELQACLDADPSDVPAWRLAAAMARRDDPPRPDDAAAADARLRALAPELPPPPPPADDETWSDRLEQALARLPIPIQHFYLTLPVQWHEAAPWPLLARAQPPATPFHPALLDLPPLDEDGGDDGDEEPTCLHLFRVNLAARGDDPAAIVDRLARALHGLGEGWVDPEED